MTAATSEITFHLFTHDEAVRRGLPPEEARSKWLIKVNGVPAGVVNRRLGVWRFTPDPGASFTHEDLAEISRIVWRAGIE